jgi:hypothetical protein
VATNIENYTGKPTILISQLKRKLIYACPTMNGTALVTKSTKSGYTSVIGVLLF